MVSNIPQVWKVRNRDTTKDFHVYSVLLHMSCAAVWSAYGFVMDLLILGIESAMVAVSYGVIFGAMIRDGNVWKRTEVVKSETK